MLGLWLKELSELVLPIVETCQLCGSRRKPGRNPGLCCICQKELDHWEEKYHQCTTCSRYIISTEGTCQKCAEEQPPFVKAIAVGPYRGIIKESLSSLKYRGDRKLAVPFGRLLAQKVRSQIKPADIDVIIPVPLHEEKRLLRGFNQAELIAREVGKHLRKPVMPQILIKKTETPAQAHLSQKEREANLKGSFSVVASGKIRQARVLLVDDIFTTGNTAAECTRALLQVGAKKVYVATVATGIYFYPTE